MRDRDACIEIDIDIEEVGAWAPSPPQLITSSISLLEIDNRERWRCLYRDKYRYGGGGDLGEHLFISFLEIDNRKR